MRSLSLFFLITISIACNTDKPIHLVERIAPEIPAIVVQVNDPALKLNNGVWYYGDSLFSGYIHAFHINGKRQRVQSYYYGKEEGGLITWFETGQKESERYYRNGEKDSVHRGWWENGNLRFEYRFKNGQYDGDFKEWFYGGEPFRHIEYVEGQEIRGKGWRENGKLYMSYEMKEGRRYGLMNAQPCYTLKNERGQYIEVPANKSPL